MRSAPHRYRPCRRQGSSPCNRRPEQFQRQAPRHAPAQNPRQPVFCPLGVLPSVSLDVISTFDIISPFVLVLFFGHRFQRTFAQRYEKLVGIGGVRAEPVDIDLLHFRAGPSAGLSHLLFKGDRARFGKRGGRLVIRIIMARQARRIGRHAGVKVRICPHRIIDHKTRGFGCSH